MAGASSVINNASHIPTLSGDNFPEWKDKILLVLGCMDLDLALRVDEPAALSESSTPEEKASFEKWERSNRLSLMLVMSHVSKSIRGSIPQCEKVKDYLKAIEELFTTSDKAKVSTLMSKICGMKLQSSKSVREHIMEMRDIASELKTLNAEIPDSLLMHFILNSLPQEFGPFIISYNTHKENWSINELLTMCVQEEGRIKRGNLESANVVVHKKGKWEKGESSAKNGKNDGKVAFKRPGKPRPENACFFCKKPGHKKKDCVKYKLWLEKKGLSQPKETDGK